MNACVHCMQWSRARSPPPLLPSFTPEEVEISEILSIQFNFWRLTREDKGAAKLGGGGMVCVKGLPFLRHWLPMRNNNYTYTEITSNKGVGEWKIWNVLTLIIIIFMAIHCKNEVLKVTTICHRCHYKVVIFTTIGYSHIIEKNYFRYAWVREYIPSS